MAQVASHHRRQDTEAGDLPLYLVSEAARYLKLPVTTVRNWVIGRPQHAARGTGGFSPLIKMADPGDGLLSFNNLAELHIISSIREEHGVKLKELRKAIKFLEDTFGSDRPLLSQKMLTDGKDLFVERYGNLVSISQAGQMAMKAVLAQYLARIEWNSAGIPVRLFPITRDKVENSPRFVSIDPKIRFGKPCIARTRIPTAIIAERHNAGESVEFLADDYGRKPEEIREAICYECRHEGRKAS